MPVAQTNLQLYEQLHDHPVDALVLVHDAYELASQLFAGHYRGNGKPFVSHLVGTASVLAAHDAALEVVLAGLLHAAYQQGEFGNGRPGITPRKQEAVRRVVGPEAESLVARYTRYDWSQVPERMAQQDRPVITIRIANEVDECADRGLVYAGPRKRKRVSDGVARYVTAGERLGLAALAAELGAAFAQNAGPPPADAFASRNGSYTIRLPLDHRDSSHDSPGDRDQTLTGRKSGYWATDQRCHLHLEPMCAARRNAGEPDACRSAHSSVVGGGGGQQRLVGRHERGYQHVHQPAADSGSA